jgi:hypothetical protein
MTDGNIIMKKHNRSAIRLFVNGRIYTMNGGECAEALACDALSGTIISAGRTKRLMAEFKSCRPVIIDLQGLAVLPGFTDCHTHFCGYSLMLSRPNLDGVKSLKSCLEITSRFLKDKRPGQWLIGTGWNKNIWAEDRLPHKNDLDRIAPDNPVFLWSKDWHTGWVNSAAIKVLGISRETQINCGGVVELDRRGQLTGLLREEAANECYLRIPKPSWAEYRRALIKGQRKLAGLGFTGFHTMETDQEFRALQDLNNEGGLGLRTVYYLRHHSLDSLISLGIRSGSGNEKLKLGGLKLFIDGSLGSQTALMLQPYENSRSQGVLVMDQDPLQSLVTAASRNGIACAVHAIGDAANRLALDIFERTRDLDRTLRHRIEHCQLVAPDDIARFGKLGIIASVQPIHYPSDRELISRHWGARGRYAYPFGSLSGAGARLAFGSDTPIESPNPWPAIQAAVCRKEEGITVKEAVRAYTSNAAYSSNDEAIKGTLEPGKAADFICLSDDPVHTKPERLHLIKVVNTYIDAQKI